MDDKRYNVWCIMNEDGEFYNEVHERDGRTATGRPRYRYVGIEWVDNFKTSSFYNYRNAKVKIDELGMKELSIVGYEECEKM